MGCSYRVVDPPGSNRDLDNFTGEIDFSYRTSLGFRKWLNEVFGFGEEDAAASGRIRHVGHDLEQQEFTETFVSEIVARFPDPEETPFPGLMRVFHEAELKGTTVHYYA